MQIMDLMILFYPMVPAILYIPYLYTQFTSYLDCTTYILNSARNYSEAADCIQKGIFRPHLWLVFQIKEYEKCILTAWPAFQTSR